MGFGLGVWFFLELFPVPRPNLYPIALKTHFKNPHIHWLEPFCWGAVSQWLPFFMLVVHQIKTETTEEECELTGTKVNCWKNEWCQHPALPPLLPQSCWCSPRHHLQSLSGGSHTPWIHRLCLLHLLEKFSYSWTFPIISTSVVSRPNSTAFLSHLFFPCPETLNSIYLHTQACP